MKIAICYSGGLDSFILHHYAKINYPDAEVVSVYYAHGAESEKAELKAIPPFVKVRKMDWLDDQTKPLTKESDPFASAIYIPGRNLIFASLVACQELPDQVWMGTMWDEDNEQATDKNSIFREMTSNLLTYVLSPFKKSIQIRFPFVEEKMTKMDSVRWALTNGISPEQLKATTSCWHNIDGIPCGECKQCGKRMLVFELNGIQETYKIHPMSSVEQRNRFDDYVSLYNSGKANLDEETMAKMILAWGKLDSH